MGHKGWWNTWEYGFDICTESGGDGFGFGITYANDGSVIIHSLETPYGYFIRLGWLHYEMSRNSVEVDRKAITGRSGQRSDTRSDRGRGELVDKPDTL